MEGNMAISFRISAGFGKRMEYKLVGDMLKYFEIEIRG